MLSDFLIGLDRFVVALHTGGGGAIMATYYIAQFMIVRSMPLCAHAKGEGQPLLRDGHEVQ
jgi:hypothetical protein